MLTQAALLAAAVAFGGGAVEFRRSPPEGPPEGPRVPTEAEIRAQAKRDRKAAKRLKEGTPDENT